MNPHGFLRTILSRMRMPVPPLARILSILLSTHYHNHILKNCQRIVIDSKLTFYAIMKIQNLKPKGVPRSRTHLTRSLRGETRLNNLQTKIFVKF